MRETFELIGAEIQAGGAGMLPAGLILTGGGAQLAGIAELGREVLSMPVRVVAPSGVGGLTDSIQTPAYATSIGLLQWGATMLEDGEPMRYESAPVAGVLGRIRNAVKSMLP
jgi:cell division protein FtsA